MGNMAEQRKKKPLTREQVAECARLKAIWERKKSELGLTQESLGAKLGASQGAITQYFNGHTKIGDVLLLKMSYHLQFNPEEVRPDFFRENPELLPDRRVHPNDRPKNADELRALELARRIVALGSQGFSAIDSMLSALER